jgi:hypothetical protein
LASAVPVLLAPEKKTTAPIRSPATLGVKVKLTVQLVAVV